MGTKEREPGSSWPPHGLHFSTKDSSRRQRARQRGIDGRIPTAQVGGFSASSGTDGFRFLTRSPHFPGPWNEFPNVVASVPPMRVKPCYREQLTVIGVRGPFIGGQASTVKTALKRQTQRRMKAHNGCPLADWSRLGRTQRGQSWNVNRRERNPICCFPIHFAFLIVIWWKSSFYRLVC